ncbi:hypothetical protein [Devosia yakushimensis]|uniref:hypothetical protein n=1 Tax=Devosia yakushimensis TaxID=470028 RepID=UPI0024E1228B|nr:hypothetical protein [Devosia yakushimensis]
MPWHEHDGFQGRDELLRECDVEMPITFTMAGRPWADYNSLKLSFISPPQAQGSLGGCLMNASKDTPERQSVSPNPH